MTGKRRLTCVAGSALLALLGCLEPIESNPDSSRLSITPQIEAVSIEKVGTTYSFSVPLQVRNTGTVPAYVDLIYRQTEKLVDQKWKVAAESTPTNVYRVVPPFQVEKIVYVVTYKPGAGFPLFDPVRGLYRVGLRALYESDGNPTLEQISYSSPFVVVDNDAGN